MGCETILLQTEKSTGNVVPGLLNWKFNDELLSPSSAVIVCMPPELVCDRPLLEFLHDWSIKFAARNKEFFVIPGSSGQLETINSSYGDLTLTYASSIAEVNRLHPDLFEEVKKPDIPVSQKVSLTAGETVTVSGEYACRACRTTRMLLKGDISAECRNPDCTGSGAGWDLVFDLF